ncbi:MAG: EF-hand domain-containing protein [Cephaloticoccus sp.]|nr:EF-hand domain-containing protein [Cephaloticoccus sp.]MCF7760191.1 EF-hand domain-containing protein [Cephaloticoccus sp.]
MLRWLKLILALAAGATSLQALPDAATLRTSFERIDLDKNGQISMLEWDQYSFALFRHRDLNRNDILEPDEIASDADSENIIARADTNQDGVLRIKEFMQLRRALFNVADINRGEFLNLMEYTLFRLIAASGWDDTNHNGRFDFSELRASLVLVFGLADTDQDKELSPTEAGFIIPEDYARATAKGPLNAEALYLLYRYHLTGE